MLNNIWQDNIWQICLQAFFCPPCWKYMTNLWQSNDRQQLDCFSTCSEEGLAGTLCFLMDLRVRPKAGFYQNRRNFHGICLGNFWVLNGKLRRENAHKMSQNGIWVGKLISHDTCAEDVANLANLRVYLEGIHSFCCLSDGKAWHVHLKNLAVKWEMHEEVFWESSEICTPDCLYIYIYIFIYIYTYIYIYNIYIYIFVLQLNFENWHWIPSTWNRPPGCGISTLWVGVEPRHFPQAKTRAVGFLPPKGGG